MDKFKVENKIEAIVVFASSKDYLGNLDVDINKLHLIFRGKKEYVIECKDHVILDKILRMCKAQDTYFPQAKEIITWLEQEGIKYFIATNAPSV